MVVKSVAVIGAGPAGAITIDALVQEKTFDVIRVFERREAAGGCWIDNQEPPPRLTELQALSSREADKPLPVPPVLPAQTPPAPQPRYAESSIYPYMETNVDFLAMQFSQEDIPADKTALSISLHGADTPFRHYSVLQRYVRDLVGRNGYSDLVEYNTTVERVDKVGDKWKLTLRKGGERLDYWWVEWFDAVIVASGHYWVPYVPHIDGLEEFERNRPGSVLHSKHFRGRDDFQGKRVVVVGASVSAADIAVDLTQSAEIPVHAVMIGRNANGYFGDEAFEHPSISKHPTIARVDAATRTVHFVDGTSVAGVDHVIFGTGYTWTLPALPQVGVRNNRVPGLYQHVVWRGDADATLLFVGAVGAGLTFKIFEWQAVYAARLLAGRGALPPLEERDRWERDRVRDRGDGPKFTLVFPDFEDYFETLRTLAGPPRDGKGRALPPFEKEWEVRFMEGHEIRKRMWRRLNAQARGALVDDTGAKTQLASL